MNSLSGPPNTSLRRECTKCKTVKYLEDFAPSPTCRSGRSWECLACRNARRKFNREARRRRGLKVT